jgi:hypothetical protein
MNSSMKRPQIQISRIFRRKPLPPRLFLNPLIMLDKTGRDAIGQVARHMIEYSRPKVPDQHIDLKIRDRQTVGGEIPASMCLKPLL